MNIRLKMAEKCLNVKHKVVGHLSCKIISAASVHLFNGIDLNLIKY